MPRLFRSPYNYYRDDLRIEDDNVTDYPGDCTQIHEYNWTDKCNFVTANDDCQDVDGFINYASLLYCQFGESLFPVGIMVYLIWLLLLFIALAVSADDFFCPNIEVIAKTLRLSQNVAGVTIMALGNGAPDIFSSLAGISAERPELVFGELFGAGVFVTTIVAGSVAVTKPFKVMERPFLRDVTFYLVAGFWAFFIFWRQEIRLYDSLGFLGLYVVYIVVVVIGRFINNKTRSDQQYAQQDNEYEETEGDEELPVDPEDPNSTDETKILAGSEESMSFGLRCHQLANSLAVISRIEWAETGIIGRSYMVLKAPLVLLFKLTIPLIDPENGGESWCQFLVVLQCLITPTFSVFATAIAFDKIWSLDVYQIALIISPFLAILVSFTSRPTQPPVYYSVLAFAGFIASVVWIYIIANELVSLLKAFGVVFGLSDAILGLTVLAWGNSIGDLIADTAMAKRGNPRTGFSACFGGPLFNLLLGIGLPFTIQLIANGGQAIPLQFNVMTLTLSIGLGASLIFSFLYLPLAKFRASRMYGIIVIITYVVFLAICFVVQFSNL